MYYRQRRISLESIAGSAIIHCIILFALFCLIEVTRQQSFSPRISESPDRKHRQQALHQKAPVIIPAARKAPAIDQQSIPLTSPSTTTIPEAENTQHTIKAFQAPSHQPAPLHHEREALPVATPDTAMLIPPPADPPRVAQAPSSARVRRHHAWHRNTKERQQPSSAHQTIPMPRNELAAHAARLAAADIEKQQRNSQEVVSRTLHITRAMNKGFADDAFRAYGRRVAHKIVFGLNASRLEGVTTPFEVQARITIDRTGKVLEVVMDPEKLIRSPLLKHLMDQMATVLRHTTFDRIPSLWHEDQVTFPCLFSSEGTRDAQQGPLAFKVVDYGNYW